MKRASECLHPGSSHLSSQRGDSQHLVDLLQPLVVLQHRAQLVQEGSFIRLVLGRCAAAPHPVFMGNAVRQPRRSTLHIRLHNLFE